MKGPIAVLCSGGLDSAVLLGWASRRHKAVIPLFVESGFRWERGERRGLELFLRRARLKGARPLEKLSLESRDVVRRRWMLSGPVPGKRSPDSAVYIPGRNLLLLSKAAVYCAERGIGTVALGVLRGNPFPDSTPRFFSSFSRTASAGLGVRLRVLAPFRNLSKAAVIRLGAGLPLGETLSCLDPKGARHCGRCNKCRERRDGFRAAGVTDPTRYI